MAQTSSGYAELLTSPAGTVLRQIYASFLSSAIERSHYWGVPDTSYAILKDQSVYELVRRDAVVFACMEARKHAVASTSWGVVPVKENPIDAKAAAIVEDGLQEIDDFDSCRLKLADADFTGSSYAKITGKRVMRSLGGTRPMMWWIPTQLIDIDRRRVLLTLDKSDKQNPKWGIKISNPFDMGKWEVVPPERRQWLVEHVYDDTEISLGYGRGLIDSLYHYVFAKAKIFIEAVQAVERWGQGRTILYIDPNRPGSDGKDNQSLLNEAVALFNKTMARHTGALLKGDEATLLAGPGEGWQLIDSMLTRVDGGIARAVLGAVMPSGGEAGDSGGSFARAKVEQDSSQTLISFSQRALAATLNRSVIDLFWRLNRMNFMALGLGQANRPRFSMVSESVPDPDKVAERAVKLLGAGIPLKKTEVYEGTDFTVPGPHDEVIQGQQPQQIGPDGQPVPGAPPPEQLLSQLKNRVASNVGAGAGQQMTPMDKLKSLIANPATPSPLLEKLKAMVAAPEGEEEDPFAKYFNREFDEQKHPRGDQKNPGRFVKKGTAPAAKKEEAPAPAPEPKKEEAPPPEPETHEFKVHKNRLSKVQKILDHPEYEGWNLLSLDDKPSKERAEKCKRIISALTGEEPVTDDSRSAYHLHRILKATAVAYARMASVGFDVKGATTIRLDKKSSEDVTRKGFAAQCEFRTGTIEVSKHTDSWWVTEDQYGGKNKLEIGKGMTVGETLMIHETGHALHFDRRIPDKAPWWIQRSVRGNTGLSPEERKKPYRGMSEETVSDLKKIPSESLSEYGRQDPYEFVAETFVRIVTGKPVHKDAMKWYKWYKGPLPASEDTKDVPATA